MSVGAWALLALAALGLGLAAAARLRERRTLRRLSQMLDEAITGDFFPDRYDETQLSAVEDRLSRYLDQCATSSKAQAQRQRKLETLLSDISHQTKTPLANLTLYTQLLEERQLPAEDRSCVEALAAQTEKLRFLMDALVKTARMESGVIAVEPGVNSVAALLEEVERQAVPLCRGRGIRLTVEKPELQAIFDRKWTAEAICNLVDNAAKYAPAGSAVTVSAAAQQHFCCVSVTDQGPGIPEAERAKVFARFYRSPSVADKPGVGVGLYLTREIVTRQGGYCKLTSAPGGGSAFSLFLPREM